MKQRLISSAILAAILIPVAIFSGVPFVINFFIAYISFVALQETLSVTSCSKNKILLTVCSLFALIFPFAPMVENKVPHAPAFCMFIFAMVMLLTFLTKYKTISFHQFCIAFTLSIVIPLFFTSIYYLRAAEYGIYNLIFMVLCSWGADSGGYIFGGLYGRHKLCPEISPKKTVEGAIGGILTSVVTCMCLAHIANIFNPEIDSNMILIIVYSIIVAVFSILGDLVASLIKRNFKVKDFGSVIPGHGGIMDRFDSILFASPVLLVFIFISPVFY